MKLARPVQWLLMLALLVAAPVALYVGFILPGLLSPFIGLSDGAEQIQRLSGGLVVALYVGVLVVTLTGRLERALKLLAICFLLQLSTVVVVVLADPVFRDQERAEAIQERFDAAIASHPTQVWCNGGFAHLRQDDGEIEYDVMLHLPASQGEFALRIGQYRVSDEHRSCDASLFAERYEVARQWFEACPEAEAGFESLVDRIRRPTDCPHPTIHHWPKDEVVPDE